LLNTTDGGSGREVCDPRGGAGGQTYVKVPEIAVDYTDFE
jgi:hypothetical protein